VDTIENDSRLNDRLPMDNAGARPAHLSAHHCRLCSLTPLSHGLLPIAGCIFAALTLALVCAFR
jgi:hypothetical protein